MYGHIKTNEEPDRASSPSAATYEALYPPDVRIAIVLDNFSPHLSTKRGLAVSGTGRLPITSSSPTCPPTPRILNRIECHFTALRYFALNGTDHQSHEEQNSMIRRYIAWRNRNKDNEAVRAISLRAKVA